MKKLIAAAIVLSAFSAMLTGCSSGNNESSNTSDSSQTTTSQSQTTTQPATTPMETSRPETGDIDGDGLIEDIVTDATGIVDDVVTGAESIVGDIADGSGARSKKQRKPKIHGFRCLSNHESLSERIVVAIVK